MHDIEKQIESFEKEFAKESFEPSIFGDFKNLMLETRQQKRFFDIIIKYKLYMRRETKNFAYLAISKTSQLPIYERYIPNFFFQVLISWCKTEKQYIKFFRQIYYWEFMHVTANHAGDPCTIAVLFLATIKHLYHHRHKQHLLDNILKHPIYKKMIPLCDDFFKTLDRYYLHELQSLCFEHIKNVRKTYNFYDDPWLNYYSDLQSDDEYKKSLSPYYHYMDTHNIDYKDKLIFYIGYNNIGDVIFGIQAIIHWSLKHNVGLIALLTPKQSTLINSYYKDYFDHIIIRDADMHLSYIGNLLFPAPNRAINVDVYKTQIPYYKPASHKRHFNLYTHDDLHDPNADMGDVIPICDTAPTIKQGNQTIIKAFNIEPEKIILIAPNSNGMDRSVRSNVTLKEFWFHLVVCLKKEGFMPIMNLSSVNEKHYFDDITSIHIESSHIVDFVNNIGGFIGARSGLCDLLCLSDNQKKYCVYPIEYIDWCNDIAKWFHMVHFTFGDEQQHIDNIINSLKGKNVKAFENQECYGYLTYPDYSSD